MEFLIWKKVHLISLCCQLFLCGIYGVVLEIIIARYKTTSSNNVFVLVTGENGTTKKHKKVHTSLNIKIFNVYYIPFFLHLHAYLNKTKWMIFHRPLSLLSKDTSHPMLAHTSSICTVLCYYVVSSSSWCCVL